MPAQRRVEGANVLDLAHTQGSLWDAKPRVAEDGHVFSVQLASATRQRAFTCAAFTCSGSAVVSGCAANAGSASSAVLLLHLRANRVSTLGHVPGSCTCVAAHPLRAAAAAAGSNTGALAAFNTEGTATQTDLLRVHRGAVQQLHYSACGAYLISGSSDAVVIWDSRVRACSPAPHASSYLCGSPTLHATAATHGSPACSADSMCTHVHAATHQAARARRRTPRHWPSHPRGAAARRDGLQSGAPSAPRRPIVPHLSGAAERA